MTSPCVDTAIIDATSGCIMTISFITSFELENLKLSSTTSCISTHWTSRWIIYVSIAYNQSFYPRAGSFDEIELFWTSIVRDCHWSKTWIFIVVVAYDITVCVCISFVCVEICSILAKTLWTCGSIYTLYCSIKGVSYAITSISY